MRQLLTPESVVLDLGSNRGGFSREMIRRFNCRCYAAEANPTLCHQIPQHEKLKAVNVAIAGSSSTMPFYVRSQDETSSLQKTGNCEPSEILSVRAVKLEDFVNELGLQKIDLLKVDIEGAEIEVLMSCSDSFLESIPQITVEFHDFNGIISRKAAETVVARMQQLGFDVITMWMRSYGDTLFLNRRVAYIGSIDLHWSRLIQRNYWWFLRFLHRKFEYVWPATDEAVS
jgi:FkbM family methyltransferase